jgi:hypothetical protein
MKPPWLRLPLHTLRKDPLAFLPEVAARGDLVCIGCLPRPVFFANHPVFIRYVLQDNYLNYGKGPAEARPCWLVHGSR